MKAIETRWNGFRFRSRAEARWAVALTAAGIRFEYEREAFSLKGGAYLPDFWLPDRGFWIEVKGQHPTRRELDLAEQLVDAGQDVRFAIGAPDATAPGLLKVEGRGRLRRVPLVLPLRAYEAARAARFEPGLRGLQQAAVATPRRPEGWDAESPGLSIMRIMAAKRREQEGGE